MSPISIKPAFRLCTSSPMPGIRTTIVQSASRTISISPWPTPTVSTRIICFSGRVEKQRRVSGGLRKPAQITARGHRANEYSCVGRVALHANAVAEDRSASEWTRGIHGDDTDGFLLAAIMAGEAIHQRALARSRRAGDADAVRIAGVREKLAQDFFGLRLERFSIAETAREIARTSPARTCSAQFSTETVIVNTAREW